jgi:hypothetical protein
MRWIFRASKVVDGKRIYASAFGKKAFCIPVPIDGGPPMKAAAK